ncbi:MAG TPA: hypothetical protein VNV85_15730 [Puia sp.]|nr:hypothetical protein [Puia sp.]
MKRFLYILGLLVSIVATVNMLLQWYISSGGIISQNELGKQESISSIFLIFGIYLILTFRRKTRTPF